MLDTVAAARVARRERLKRIADAAVPDSPIDLKDRLKNRRPFGGLRDPLPRLPKPPKLPRAPTCVLELAGFYAALASLPAGQKPTSLHIQRAVVDKFRIAIGDLSSVDRRHRVCWPRMVSMFLCRKIQGISLPTVGRIHGDRDHTTAMSAIKKVLKVAATNPRVIDQVSDILEDLRAQNFRVPETVEELFV